MSYKSSGVWPQASMGNYSVPALAEALSLLHAQNSRTSFSVGTADPPAGLAATAYRGAAVDPINMRAYLSPLGQATSATWHYIDLRTGRAVGYTHGASSLQSNAYTSGSYHHNTKRIYLAPYEQYTVSVRHYIDCAAGGTVVQYSNPYLHGSLGYVQDPVTGIMYSVPSRGASVTHVIDNAGQVSSRSLPFTPAASMVGAAYSATQRKIYVAMQGPDVGCVHADCQSGTYGYAPLVYSQMVSAGAYEGAVYSPVQDRIYFVPAQQAALPVWHYVDCRSGLMVEYQHGCSGLASWAYFGGVYSPATNRVYLVPNGQALSDTWHYIDCSSGKVVSYLHRTPTSSSHRYSGGFYNPLLGRIHFVGRHDSGSLRWHYIQEYAPPSVPAHWPSYTITSA